MNLFKKKINKKKTPSVSSENIWSSCPLKILLNYNSQPLNSCHIIVSEAASIFCQTQAEEIKKTFKMKQQQNIVTEEKYIENFQRLFDR